MIPHYFEKEISETASSVLSAVKKDSLVFALVTDTHLSDTGYETCCNIRETDKAVGFDFIMHLGDFLAGNIPEKASFFLYDKEAEMYRKSISANKLAVVLGNHDGYRNESFKGQLADNIIFDDLWYRHTYFINDFENLAHPAQKPYYYIDFPEKNIRIICLSSSQYTFRPEALEYTKLSGFDDGQCKWFEQDALNVPEGYTVLIFSHIAPLDELDSIEYPANVAAGGGEKMVEILRTAVKNKNITVAAWMAGDSHADVSANFYGINFITTASQTPYIPQLWRMKMGEFPKNRDLGTVNQDLWDAVVVTPSERTLSLFRFGYGIDRIIRF